MISGLLLVDKPSGPTSHDVVSMARRALGLKKVGHAGTLDPMATGLLTLGVGQGTKLLTFLVGSDKRYLATVRLGATTTTDDAEGAVVSQSSVAQLDELTEATIREAFGRFVGEIDQIPSSVSAIKVDGQRAYDLVRAGEKVDLKARRITIYLLEVTQVHRSGEFWDVDIDVSCSSGTYIRSIARDVGEDLGVGGHLTSLRRLAVGPFTVDQACSPEQISATQLKPLGQAASTVLPSMLVSKAQALELGHGMKVFLSPPDSVPDGDPVACLDDSGRLVAVVRIERGVGHILVGFPEQ